MSILILGGTGFLGQAVLKTLLHHKKDVVILTRNPTKVPSFKNVPKIVANLLHLSKIDLSPYHTIINCAGEISNENLMRDINIKAPLNLLQQFAEFPNRHWIQMSSVGVYGKPKHGIITESSEHLPFNEYEKTKSEGELAIKAACDNYSIHYTILRPSNVFGVDMPNQSLAQLIKLIKKKWFFYIGKSHQTTMNYVPVEDVAHCVLHCLDNVQAYNQDFIVSDCLYLTELVALVLKIFGIKQNVPTIPSALVRGVAKTMSLVPGFPLTLPRVEALTSRVIYSTEKVEKHLNFMPFIGVKKALINYCQMEKFIL